MKQQVHLVSLGVSDVAAARRFYCDGLGFELIADLDTVVFVQGGYSLALGLITNEDLAADMGIAVPPPGGSMVTLAHNVASQDAVDDFIAAASRAGALVLKHPQRAEWGAYSGYFKDPDGHIWEVASGGVAFDETGRAILG